MIIKCYVCDAELEKPGALVFSPPYPGYIMNSDSVVEKMHLCGKCWFDLVAWCIMKKADKRAASRHSSSK